MLGPDGPIIFFSTYSREIKPINTQGGRLIYARIKNKSNSLPVSLAQYLKKKTINIQVTH